MAIAPEREADLRARFHEYTRTLDCVHCGLCLPDCPTYDVTGRESSSPRGRIYLMRGWTEGSIELTDGVRQQLEECIVCRACETVCPSGIRMGEMMESFRAELDRTRSSRGFGYRVSRLLLRHVLPYRRRIRMLTDLLWLYQRLGLRRIGSWVARRLPGRLAALDAMQPTVPSPAKRRLALDDDLPEGRYLAHGTPRMRVGLFLGCIASEWFAGTHRATIRVLQRSGCDVSVPSRQTCCGALHRHAGFLDEAHELYGRSRSAFLQSGVDAIVVNAAGCGAALKEPPPELEDGLGVPVRDICELLDEIGIAAPSGRLEKRVVYDQPCHLLHGQKIGPGVVERLIGRIPGVELVPLTGSDRCCGSGGVYNLVHPDLASRVLEDKVAHIRAAAPDIVVTGNPGCAMQIASGLAGAGIEVMHPVELLDRAYGDE